MKLNIEPQVIIHGWLGGLGSSIATMRGPQDCPGHPPFLQLISSLILEDCAHIDREISEGLSTEMFSEATSIFSL